MTADDSFWDGVERHIDALLAAPFPGAVAEEESKDPEFWAGVERLIDRALALPWRDVAKPAPGYRPRTDALSPSPHRRPPAPVRRWVVHETPSHRVRDVGVSVPALAAATRAHKPAGGFPHLDVPLADAMRSTLRYLEAKGATRPDAEDALQEALVLVVRRPELLAEPARARVALLRFALVTYRKALIRAERRRLHEEPVAELPDAAVPDEAESEEVVARAVLRDALARVSAEQRRYMYFVAVEGRTINDIAASSMVTSATIRKSLARARQMLRQAYADMPP